VRSIIREEFFTLRERNPSGVASSAFVSGERSIGEYVRVGGVRGNEKSKTRES